MLSGLRAAAPGAAAQESRSTWQRASDSGSGFDRSGDVGVVHRTGPPFLVALEQDPGASVGDGEFCGVQCLLDGDDCVFGCQET